MMQQFKDQLKSFVLRNPVRIDRYYTISLCLLVALTIFVMMQLLYKPVTTSQKQYLQQYTTQSLYPYTQDIAVDLIEQSEPIRQYQYFRFLRIMYFEQQRIRFQKEDES